MATCGRNFTVVVTEPGDVFAWGAGVFGQLGLNIDDNQLLPERVAGRKVFSARMVMVAAGTFHSAGVTADGTLLTWGNGAEGQLGHGDLKDRLRPERISRELLGGQLAVMVACGVGHTMVLTVGGLWTCGEGKDGKLGHGDEANRLALTQVATEHFDGNAQIVMVAAGALHSVVMGSEGGVWTWGFGMGLGHNDMQNKNVPTLLPGAAFAGGKVVMVAAGGTHTVTVTSKGELWAWGKNSNGQLGIVGLEPVQIEPTLVGAKDVFGGSPVHMAACGYEHTLIVTEEGTLWTCGQGENGALGHNDINDRRVPTLVEAHHFGNAKVVSAAGGRFHSAVVTEHGGLYTWGQGQEVKHASPAGLGHDDMLAKLVPTCVAPHLLQGARVGRCHSLPPLHALAFAMGTHSRLGSAAPTATSIGLKWRCAGIIEPTVGRLLTNAALADDLCTKLEFTQEEWADFGIVDLNIDDYIKSELDCVSSYFKPVATPAGGGSRKSRRQEGKAPAAATNISTDCAYMTMPGELVQRVVEACASWPEGQAGEMEGVVRLLGGMMKDKVSH